MHLSEMERAQAATMRGPAQPATYRRTGPIALACYTAGSLTAALPGPGATTGTVITHLTAHRSGCWPHDADVPRIAVPLLFLSHLVNLLAEAEGPPGLLTFLPAGAWLMLFVIITAGMRRTDGWSGMSRRPEELHPRRDRLRLPPL